MKNPNACEHCGHKQNPDGGWCYMFRMEPTGLCAQHTKSCAVPMGFLSDVVTAAGLLAHGKTDKALAQRICDTAYALMTELPNTTDDRR